MAVQFNPFTGNLDIVGAGASANPGGSDTQVQFNDGGSFAGSADLTWDDTGKVLGVGGDIDLDDGGTYATTLQVITPTADRTISFPNATGTLALVAGSSGQLIYNNAGANAGTPTLTYDGSILTSNGRFINSYNATASSPAKAFTGTWFTGGTATTTKPQVLIEPSGTTSTAWSTSGTGLGVNAASGFAGNLLDLQVNGSNRFRVNSAGSLLAIDGSASSVAYGFSSAINTGLRLSTANDLRITVAGYDAVFLTQTRHLLQSNLGEYAIGTAQDVILARDAADTFAQRRGTNAQTYRLYNTYTDASNYQRTSITDDSTGLVIDQQYAGTGAARTNLLDLKVNGARQFATTSAGNLILSGDNGRLVWVAVNGRFALQGAGGTGLAQLDLGGLVIGSSSYTSAGVLNSGASLVDSGYFGNLVSLSLINTAAIGWKAGTSSISGTTDLFLFRDAANTLAQRNGTNAQTYRLYNTYTDASNYERVAFKWDTNTFKIEPEAAGTGTLRSLAFSANGAASTPPISLTGTWFSGGTSTTTKPALLIEPSGTTSTAWSTSGTGLGVNAPSGFTGNLLDLQVNGTSQLRVNQQGDITSGGGNTFIPDSRGYRWSTRGGITAPSDGIIQLTNGAGTGFSILRLGGGTTGFPAVKRNNAELQVRLADDSAYTTLDAQLRAQGTAPASASATGTAGDIRYDADYVYICTATDTWKRAALSTWP